MPGDADRAEHHEHLERAEQLGEAVRRKVTSAAEAEEVKLEHSIAGIRLPRVVTHALPVVKATVRESIEDRITTSAASLAFHWFLALFPAVLAFLGVTQLLGLSSSQLSTVVHDVGVLFPRQISQVLSQALETHSSSSTGVLEVIFGLVIALWSSAEAMASLQVGLDVAFEVERDRGFLGRRIMALPLIGVTLVAGGTASALLILGDPIRAILPSGFALARPAAGFLWDIARWAGAFVLLLGLLSAYYRLGPNRVRPRWRWLTAGSVVAALAWLGASAGFSYYLNDFAHESRTYGSFAGVAVMLLWLFLTAVAVLVGAELDCELSKQRAAEAAQKA